MKTLSVGEFKARFSDVLELVKSGKSVGISFGKKKEPIAMIVPFAKAKRGKRKIGILEGKSTLKIADDFKITEEELAHLK